MSGADCNHRSLVERCLPSSKWPTFRFLFSKVAVFVNQALAEKSKTKTYNPAMHEGHNSLRMANQKCIFKGKQYVKFSIDQRHLMILIAPE